MNLYELISTTLWPLVALTLGIFYKNSIENRKTVTITLLPGVEIKLGEKDAQGDVGELIHELNNIYNRLLKKSHKEFFLELLKSDKEKKVIEVIPNFDHDNKEHIGKLRALRGLGMINPVGGGKWEADKYITKNGFGEKFSKFLDK